MNGLLIDRQEDGKVLIFKALSDKCIDEPRRVSDFYDSKEAIEMGLYEEFEKRKQANEWRKQAEKASWLDKTSGWFNES
jgi:hypothetical protein